jgi:hypothetical protein
MRYHELLPGLRFTRQGPINDDLGALMCAIIKRAPRYYIGFFTARV